MLSIYAIYLLVGIATGLCAFSAATFLPQRASRYSRHVEQQTAQSLNELFLFMPVRVLLVRIGISAMGFAVIIAIFSRSPSLAIASAVMTLVTPWWLLSMQRARRRALFYQQLPDALLLLTSSLRSGRALSAGIQILCKEMEAPLAQEFTLVQRQMRLGQSLEGALNALFVRMPSVDLERVIIALKLAQESGGQQAVLLEQLSVNMRSKQQLQRRIMALTAQGRLQGKVMTALPLLMAGALWFIEKPTMLVLSQHPLGWITAVVILLLLAGGYWVIRKQVHIEVPL